MKKYFMTILAVMIFTVASITAVSLGTHDTTVDLTKPEKTALASIGITNPATSTLDCDNEMCYFYISEGSFRYDLRIPRRYCDIYSDDMMSCSSYSDYSDNELIQQRDIAIQEYLKLLATATISRQSQADKTPTIGGGSVTING